MGLLYTYLQGSFVFIPLSNTECNTYVTGYLALLGGTLFEIGAYCMILEALNQHSTVRFGFEVKSFFTLTVLHEVVPLQPGNHLSVGPKRFSKRLVVFDALLALTSTVALLYLMRVVHTH